MHSLILKASLHGSVVDIIMCTNKITPYIHLHVQYIVPSTGTLAWRGAYHVPCTKACLLSVSTSL